LLSHKPRITVNKPPFQVGKSRKPELEAAIKKPDLSGALSGLFNDE
jgi:hypothetical protein